MAEEEDPLQQSDPEHDSLKDNVNDPDSSIELEESSSDVKTLKKRMDKSDQEMQEMIEAMKSTLHDVRTLMKDIDNPLNLLQDMGVDPQVNETMENIEDKPRQSNSDVEIEVELVNDNHTNSVTDGIETVQASSGVASNSDPKQGIELNPVEPSPTNPEHDANNLVLNNIHKRLSESENLMQILAEKVARIDVKLNHFNQIDHYTGSEKYPDNEFINKKNSAQFNNVSDGVYYEGFVDLVSEYLILLYGEEGADDFLLEAMYKEWASPKVVRDIMDQTKSELNSQKKPLNSKLSNGVNQDIEDKILITSLIKNLDKPVNRWEEPSHFFLLLSLVKRTRELLQKNCENNPEN